MKKMTPKERKEHTWNKTLNQPWLLDQNQYIDLIHCENLVTQIYNECGIQEMNNEIIIKMCHVVEVLNYRTKNRQIAAADISEIPIYNHLKMDINNVRDMLMIARKETSRNMGNPVIKKIMQNAATIIMHYIANWDDLKSKPKAAVVDINTKRSTLRLKDRQSLPKKDIDKV